MADKYEHSNSKSSKRLKRDESLKQRSRNEYKVDSMKSSAIESKTPPLPARKTSIEELIHKRDSLKKELKKIGKHSDSDLATKYKSSKSDHNSKRNFTSGNTPSRKRQHRNHEDKDVTQKKMFKEPSPDHNGDTLHVESEDEEALIEKSRQRRKQLLEKLNMTEGNNQTEVKKVNQLENHKQIESTAIKKPSSYKRKTPNKDATDMFSEADDFLTKNRESVVQDNSEKDNPQLIDNWDNPESYYNVRIGDEINNKQYTVKSILGQGVFANVVRAQDNNQGNVDVAIKINRNNDLMYKAGLKEIEILKEIKNADPENKYHCIRFFQSFMHKSHLCLVLEAMYMDMRCIIKKYGRNHGINMKALISYSRQLLVALRLLKKLGIVHADIKPDNILVNEKKNVLKLCDFGSASKVYENEPTPYLVSRFYRAPEIILGIPYKHSIDIWSTACTMYEMATGKIMFMGSSNNKMLKCFMDLKGRFSTKLIRKGIFKDQHFNYSNKFLLHKKDEFSGREKYVEVNNVTATRDLLKEFKKYCKNINENEEKKLLQLKDILEKMLILDQNHRYTVSDCLKHPFIQEDFQK